jgi:hypothetical protein
MGHFDLLFTKKSWYSPNISIFYQYGIMVELSWMHILLHFICLNRNVIPKFVHHHFWLKPLQKLRYLLWFILINLISCDASQSTNVYMSVIFFAMGHFWLAYHQKIMESPPCPLPKI